MKIQTIQLQDVIYNAANQCFEALVVLHDGAQVYKYPCAINAPITMAFEEAAAGLSTQAQRRHRGASDLSSVTPKLLPNTPLRRAARLLAATVQHLETLTTPRNRAA